MKRGPTFLLHTWVTGKPTSGTEVSSATTSHKDPSFCTSVADSVLTQGDGELFIFTLQNFVLAG